MARTHRLAQFAEPLLAMFVLLTLVLRTARLPADDVTAEWTGDGTGDLWQDADNWSTPVLPNNGNDRYFVAISGDPNDVTVFLENRPPGTISISTLSIGSGDQLNISGVLRVQTRKTSGDDPSGLVENAGMIELGERARLVVNANTSDGSAGDTVTLTGGGKIILNEPFLSLTSPGSMIHGAAEQPRTLLVEDQIIEGTGRIGNGELRIINKKEIVANQSNKALIVDPGAGSANVTADYTNDGGTARATAGGILRLTAGTFNNINGGRFVAESNSFVDLAFGTHIHGGLLQSLGTGRLRVTGDSFLNGPANNALTIASAIDVHDGNELVLQGNITNLNTTTLMAGQRATAVLVDGNVSLTGSGIIRLDSSLPNLRRAQIKHRNPDAVLTIGNGQSVVGTGSIEGELTLKNQGTISANQVGRILTISPTGNSLENTQTLQAEDGGRLLLLSSWELNGGNGTGTIQARDESQVLLDGVTIKDQTFKTPDNPTATDPMVLPDPSRGVVRTRNVGTAIDLRDAPSTNEGLLEISNNSTLTLQSAGTGQAISSQFVNKATVFMNALTPGNASINVAGGDVKLIGGGRIVMSDSAGNQIIQSVIEPQTHTLINVDHTIEGSGNIGGDRLNFRNEVDGVVRSTSKRPLVIDPPEISPNDIRPVVVENRGTWEAVDGGQIEFRSGSLNNRDRGIIRAAGGGSQVIFEDAKVTTNNERFVLRDSIRAEDAGRIQFRKGSLVTISGGLTAEGGGVVELRGTAVQNMAGGGIVGDGINAFGDQSLVDLSAGTIIDNDGGSLRTRRGGLIRNLDMATLVDVSLSGEFLATDGSSTVLRDGLRGRLQRGRLLVGGTLAPTRIVIDKAESPTAFRLFGGMEIVLAGSQFNSITGDGPRDTMRLSHGGIRGGGRIGGMRLEPSFGSSIIADGSISFVGGSQLEIDGLLVIDTTNDDDRLRNFGLLAAEDGGVLRILDTLLLNSFLGGGRILVQEGSRLEARNLDNLGTIDVSLDSSVELNGRFDQRNVFAIAVIAGELSARRARWNGGSTTIDGQVTITDGDQALILDNPARLSGTGTINGKLISSGAFAPGKSPGTFTINGDFDQRPGGELEIEIAGPNGGTEFDQLIINGQASLDGTVIIKSLDGFVADLGSEFDVVSATSIVDNGFSLAMVSGGFVQPAVVDLGNGTSALRLSSEEAVQFTSANGTWDDSGNWSSGTIPSLNEIAFLPGETDSATTVTGPSVDTSLFSLVVGRGGEAATSTTSLALSSGILTTTHGTTLRRDGRLTGGGTLGGDLYNAGIVGSAESVASLSVTGGYKQTEDGQLVIALGGTEPAMQFSRLTVGENAGLNGELNIELVALEGDSFEPDRGDTFEIVTAGSLSGRFSVIGLPTLAADRFWSVLYEDTSVRLEVLTAIQRGDFDGNGQLDIVDINLLMADLAEGNQEEQFDINEDGGVSHDDLTMWVRDLGLTWIGDANLDGEFDSNDLVVIFAAGQYEDEVPINSSWGTGDFDANGDFDSGDLVAAFIDGGYELGPRNVVNAVPEPTSLAMLMAVLIGVASVSRSRRKPV